MYAKLLNEKTLQEAPKEILSAGRRYVGFTANFLLEHGYKPVEFNELDLTTIDANRKYESYYVENESKIVQRWRKIADGTSEEA